MAKRPDYRLVISFGYDAITGMFQAHLENGASFSFSKECIGGKLENALTLFRRQVEALAEGREYVPKPIRDDSPLIADAIAEGKLQVVGVKDPFEGLMDF